MRIQLSVETGPLAPRHRTHHQLPDASLAPFPHPPACTSPAAEKPAPSRQASSTPTFTNFAMALLPRGRCLDPGPPAYCEVGRPIDPSSSRRAMSADSSKAESDERCLDLRRLTLDASGTRRTDRGDRPLDCPIRYQCAGCPHFESDPSYLPELRAYAYDLRRERETTHATGAADSAIDNVARQLEVIVAHTRAHEQLLEGLDSAGRADIEHASATLRKVRSRGLRAPTGSGPLADNSAALRRARRQDSRTKRLRAADIIEAMGQTGEPITFPAVARRAQVSVSLLYADAESRRAHHERARSTASSRRRTSLAPACPLAGHRAKSAHRVRQHQRTGPAPRRGSGLAARAGQPTTRRRRRHRARPRPQPARR